MATERIDIIITEKGGRVVTRSIDGIGNTSQRSAKQVNGLRKVIGLLGGALAIRQLAATADAFTLITNRIRLTDVGFRNLEGSYQKLFDISQKTRTPLEQNVQLFQKAAFAANDLGASEEELFKFVEAVGKAMAIQGAGANTARGALLQLSQAVGTTIVRAEEFNSILEGAFPLAQAMARGIDSAAGSVARLRIQIIAGEITSRELFQGVLSQADELDQMFKTTIPTIGQSITVLNNAWISYIGHANQASGASEFLARSIIGLANNFDILALSVAALIAILSATFVFTKLAAAFAVLRAGAIALFVAFGTLTAGLALLTEAGGVAYISSLVLGAGFSALLAPLGLMAIAAGAVIGVYVLMQKHSQLLQVRLKAERMELEQYNDTIEQKTFLTKQDAIESLKAAKASLVSAQASNVLQWLELQRATIDAEGAAASYNETVGSIFLTGAAGGALLMGMNKTKEKLEEVRAEMDLNTAQMNRLKDVMELINVTIEAFVDREEEMAKALRDQTLRAFRALLDQIDPVGAALRDLADAEDVLNNAIAAGILVSDESGTALERKAMILERLKASLSDQLDPLGALTDALEQEMELLKLGNDERQIEVQLRRIIEGLNEAGVVATDAQTEAIRRQLEAQQQLNREQQRQASARRSVEGQFVDPFVDAGAHLDAINQLKEEGVLSAEAAKNAIDDLGLSLITLQNQMGDGTFATGFIEQMALITDAATTWRSEIGGIFGGLFETISDGFADAFADAIVFGENFGDAIRAVADQAIAALISALVKLGIQMVLNWALGETLAATATGAAVAQATIVGAAWTPAAIAASLATAGANSAPAIAGMTAAAVAGEALFAASAVAAAEGGLIRGPGTGTSDSIPAMLSDKEFVVNAKAANDNMRVLELINSGTNVEKFLPDMMLREGRTNLAEGGRVASNDNIQPRMADGGFVSSATAASETRTISRTQNGGTRSSGEDRVTIENHEAPVRVVTIFDPEMLLDVLSSDAGERLVINVIERNPDTVKRLLSR